ncbi:MAG: carbonic anhydrase [Arhodomonas sp.]|nr:carbonic anhydrase [Arhodomonas sp.]
MRRASTRAGCPCRRRGTRRIVACMDARLDVYRLIGLGLGEAHVIRNAGGVVSDDDPLACHLPAPDRHAGDRRSSTDCGMLTFRRRR